MKKSATIISTLLFASISISINAQAASCHLPKSYYKNVSCTASSGYFLAKKDSGKPVALLDKSGKLVVNLMRYQRVAEQKLAEGLLPVQRNNKVGYINMKGKEVVPAVYDVLTGTGGWARRVANGRIVVKQNGRLGVISTTNTVIVPFSSQIASIRDYRQGRAKMVRNGVDYWLDRSGKKTKIQTLPTATDTRANQNNVTSSALPTDSNSPITPTNKNLDMNLRPHSMDGKWGFVDDNNVAMITYSFDEVMPYSEGLAGVRIDDKWGFIDKGGNLLIQFRFSESGVVRNNTQQNSSQQSTHQYHYRGKQPFVFTDGRAWIGNLADGRQLCIDKMGMSVSCK